LTRALHEKNNERLVSPVCGGEIMKYAGQPAYLTGFRREVGEVPCPVGFSI
jgi:hypothetical protein